MTTQPRFQIPDRHRDVGSQAVLGDGALEAIGRHQLRSRCLDLAVQALDLMRTPGQHMLEGRVTDRNQIRVNYPCAIETLVCLALLVAAYDLHRTALRLGIVSIGNLRGDTAQRMRATSMTCADQKLGISAHEWQSHRQFRTIGQDKIRSIPELLRNTEQIIPTTGS